MNTPVLFSEEEFTLEHLMSSNFFGDTTEASFVDEDMGAPPELIPIGHSGRSDGRGVTSNDWEDDAESESFARLKKNIRLACNVNTKRNKRNKAMEWIFKPGQEDADGISFDLCCSALSSRADLLRVRLQYQLFDSHIITDPLPFMSHGIPQIMRNEIEYFCKPRSIEVAKILWENPGIRLDIVSSRLSMSPGDLEPIISSLETNGYAGFWLGHGWFIGKNPLIMPRAERMKFKWTEIVL